MSATGSPSPDPATPSTAPARSRMKGCLVRIVLVVLLVIALLVGWGVYVSRSIKSDSPLDFPAFRYRPLEKSLLIAKFEVLDLGSRLFSDGVTDVWVNERELNALLFGNADHDENQKARILIREDRFLVEWSGRQDDGSYRNVQAEFTCELGPGTTAVTLQSGQAGDYTLGPVTRLIFQRILLNGLREARDRDRNLRRVHSLSIEKGQVRLTYDAN